MAPDPSPKKTAHYFWVVLRVVIVFFSYFVFMCPLYFPSILCGFWCALFTFLGLNFGFSGLSVFIRMEIFCVCSDSRIVDGSSL